MFGERFPLLRWFPVSWAFLRADIVAGITVAFVAVPQWMAYAGLAGLSPIHGLWCCVLPMALGAIFGWCHQLNTGPVAMSSLLTASVLAPLAVPFTDAWAGLALTLAFLVGLIRIALGLLQAGQLTALISHPVLAGFTTAAALIICLSQVPLLLGLTPLQGTWFLGDVVRSLTTIQSPAWASVTMGLGCLGAMLALRRWAPRWPGVLLVTAIATGLSWLLDYSGRTVGLLPSGLPSLTLPQLSWGMLNDLWAGALLVTLIGFAEVLTVTKACAASTRQSIDLNRELIGQGMASLGAAGSGGFPPSGSLSRSALSLAAGARTGLTAVIAALVIAGILLFGTAALAPLPMATLAAAVIVSVLSLVDFSGLVRAWRIHAHDGAAAILAFLLTLGLAPDLISGFLIAGVLALGLFLWRAMHPRIAILAPHPDGTWRDYQRFHLPQSPHVAVLRLDRSLFFANVEALEQAVLALLHERKQLRAVVLACAGINEIDASGCAGLKSIQRVLKENNALLVISELKVPCLDTLDRAGLLAGLGADAHFRSISEAVRSVASRTGIDTLPWPIPESSPCGVVRVEDSGRLTVMRSTAP